MQTEHPPSDPLRMLRRDHDLFRRLADLWLISRDDLVREQAAKQIVMLLETHSMLEESVFYPAVRALAPAQIESFQHIHTEADDLIHALKSTSLQGERAQDMLRELIDLVLQHIDQEESQLFPLIEGATGLDLQAIGHEMEMVEANLVHQQTQTGRQGAWT